MIAELQIINHVLNNQDYSIILDNNLTPEYFPNYKDEFKFICEHYHEYNQVPDPTTFLAKFPTFECVEINESKQYLINSLYQEKDSNFLTYTFNNIREKLMNGDTDAAMELFTTSATKAAQSKKFEAIDILNDTSRYDRYLDKCNDFDKYYIKTGFNELDESLGGGIDRLNSYFVISARPGIGKTLVMVKFAAAAVSKGLRVGMYEGEMAVDKIAGRYDSIMSHISNGSITHGNINVANQYKQYLETLSNNKGKFFILTRDMVPGNYMTVDILDNFVEKYQLDMLFVDQLSLLDSKSRNLRSFEQAAEISKALKNLQVRRHIPVVVASQQNRSATEEGKIAGTENLSLSDRIGQDATEVISLSKKDDVLTIDIAKARDGAKVYRLNYTIDFDKGTFTYIPSEEDCKQTETTESEPIYNAYTDNRYTLSGALEEESPF